MQATEGLGKAQGLGTVPWGEECSTAGCSKAGAGSQSVDSVGGLQEAGQAGQADFLGATSRLELELEMGLESESEYNCQNQPVTGAPRSQMLCRMPAAPSPCPC
jgi:hypothetical protein